MSAVEFIALPPGTAGPHYRPGHYSDHEGRARYNAYLAQHVASVTPGPVLDVGCGVGHFLASLSRLGVPSMGFDLSEEAVREASRVPGVKVLVHDANREWPFPDETFSAVTLFDVIEHFENYNGALQEAGRVLRKNGWLFVVTVNRISILHLFFGPGWGALKDPEHVIYFDRRSLKGTLERNGFSVLQSKTFFNFGVAGESTGFLKPFRHPGLIVMAPEFGDSIHAIARKSK